MSAKALFGVVVRVLGLWMVLRGLGGIVVALVNGVGFDRVTLGLGQGWLWWGLYLLAGLFLLRAAPVIVRFAYGAGDESS